MHSKILLTSSNTFHTFTLFILITLLFNKNQCSYESFNACVPHSCGNLTNIRYPFWLSGKQPSYCGYPSLNISCRNNQNPTVRISNDDYVVTHINYSNHIFHLANSILHSNTISCQTPLHNITIDNTLFSFASDYAYFMLFYNCSSLPTNFDIKYPINCASLSTYNDGTSLQSFGDFHTGALEALNYSLILCQSVVDVPVEIDMSEGHDEASFWKMSYVDILKLGFTLKWSDLGCSECEASGGHCGFDNNRFVCFCKNKPHSKSCHDGKRDFKTKAAILGVAAAASGSIIFMTIFFFLYRSRLKQNLSTAPFLAQNKSYDSSNAYSSSSSDLQIVNRSTYFGVQVFNYRELEEATDFFNPLKELGDGGFGTVYYGKLQDGREVAIKRLYENNNKRADQQFMNEVEILAHLRHKNLVTLYGCTPRQSRELLLVYEYVPNGTVADHLYGKKARENALSWSKRLSIAVETASALVHLHASDIIHRDIKTQNILLDKDFSVKVADFGLSRLFPLDVTHVSTAPQGTPGYVDPEYHQCYQLTEKSDVYSFGVVLAEVISSKPAVDITRRRNEINLSNMATEKIQNHQLHELVDPSLGFQTDLKVKNEITAVAELAFQCLQGTREMRPSMEEVLELLYSIMGRKNKDSEADVVDIPADDIFLLKGDFSPSSPRKDDNRRHMPYASI